MASRVILSILKDLEDEEFSEFKWYLLNGGLTDSTIAKGELNNADRLKVVDLMVKKYKDSEAGKIAIKVLESIEQNVLADKLRKNLPKEDVPAGGGSSSAVTARPAETTAHPRDQVDGRNAPVPEEEPLLIKSDWRRPNGIIQCTQETKDRLLRENRDDIYIPKEKSQRKRLALLITNIHFADERNNRDGAEKDEKNMEWLLTALGYTVVKHRNLSGKGIENAVKTFAARAEHRNSDSTFVVIMSHGDTIQNKDAILGVNYDEENNPDEVFFVDDIFSHLNSVNCPALIDKPKVILIQACRGSHPGGVEMRGGAFESDAWVHREKDFACLMSSLPGISAYRNIVTGSYFIMNILDVFCEWAHSDHIVDLFIKVSSYMAKHPETEENKLLSSMERTSITKKFYLFPGL